jgi:hypothetical protein
MSGRTIGGLLALVIVVGLLVWNRMGARSEASAKIRADAMRILSTMEGFEQNKKILGPMADRAHGVAFAAAYKVAGRRTTPEFDEEKYLQAFFRSMMSQANDLNRQDLRKSLLVQRSAFEEAGDGADEKDEPQNAGSSAAAEQNSPR